MVPSLSISSLNQCSYFPWMLISKRLMSNVEHDGSGSLDLSPFNYDLFAFEQQMLSEDNIHIADLMLLKVATSQIFFFLCYSERLKSKAEAYFWAKFCLVWYKLVNKEDFLIFCLLSVLSNTPCCNVSHQKMAVETWTTAQACGKFFLLSRIKCIIKNKNQRAHEKWKI